MVSQEDTQTSEESKLLVWSFEPHVHGNSQTGKVSFFYQT